MDGQVIRVPKTSAKSFDPNRLLVRNQLLYMQVQHFHALEDEMPPEQRTGIARESIQTEGQAAEYIRQITARLHPHTAKYQAPKAKRKAAGKKKRAAAKPKVRTSGAQ